MWFFSPLDYKGLMNLHDMGHHLA